MKKLIIWILIVVLCMTQYTYVFCEELKFEYQFDEIVVNYAVQFKALPCNIQSDSWLTQLAGGKDKPLDIIFGEVSYKLNGLICGSEEYIKITGDNGSSEKFLLNSWSCERSPDTNEIVKEISQLWSYKRIDGNSVVKDFGVILKSVVMQKEFDNQHKIKSIMLKDGVLPSPINTDKPLFDAYKADLYSVIYFDSEINKNNMLSNTSVTYNTNLVTANSSSSTDVDIKLTSENRISLNSLSYMGTSDMFEQAISDSLRLYGVKLDLVPIVWEISNLTNTSNIISVRVTNSLNDYTQLPKLVVVGYGDNRKFLTLKSIGVENGKIDYSFDITGIAGIKTFKVFLWKGLDNIQAVASVKEI